MEPIPIDTDPVREALKYIKEHKKIRCYISAFDHVYRQQVTQLFTCLRMGTVETRARNYTTITVTLQPPFIIPPEIVKHNNKIHYVLQKALRLYDHDYAITLKRNMRILLKNEWYMYKLVEDTVASFLQNCAKRIETDPRLVKYKVWDWTQYENYIMNRYVIALSRQVIYFDTLHMGKRSEITLLLDGSTRKILKWGVTEDTPSAGWMIQLFGKLFRTSVMKRCRIVHGDNCGSNGDTDFRLYFYKRNIVQSFTRPKKHDNQVIESVNKVLKRIIRENSFDGLSANTKYDDLSKDLQLELIDHSVNDYNNRVVYQRKLFGKYSYTRNMLDEALEWFCGLIPDITTKPLILAESNSEYGELIASWKELVLKAHLLSKRQLSFCNATGFLFFCVTKDLLSNVGLVLTNNFDNIQYMDDLLNDKERALENLAKRNVQLNNEGLNKNQILNQLKLSLQAELENATTDKERNSLEREIGQLLYVEIKDKEENARFVELQEQHQGILKEFNIVNASLVQVTNENKELKTVVVTLSDKIDSLLKKKAKNKISRKKNRTLQSREAYSVMPQDWFKYVHILTEGRYRFVIAKYYLAHVLLKITGLRIGNLKYFNFQQIQNLFDKKTAMIRLIKHPFLEYQYFPYVSSMDPYLEPARPYFEYLKKCRDEGHPEIEVIDLDSENEELRERSEIYGFVNRCSFNTYFNKQLKRAGEILKPRKVLRSHSYRRGVAIICTKVQGIAVTRIVLAHARISSTEPYIEQAVDVATMREYLSAIHSIDDSKNAIYKTFNSNQEEEYVEEIESNLE
jgi:hypothetical protein